MSKAFTREGDGDEDEKEPAESPNPLPAGSKNYMTPQGEAKLREELRHLLYTARPKIVETVAWAASLGDRSENADYIYGKRRLREIDRRIRFLTKRLEAAEVIDPTAQKSETVVFGATVVVLDESGAERIYRIVGIDETDGKLGKVSWISPMGRALLRARVGDTVTVHTPRGDEELEITAIRFEPIPS
jgi:transcription elongation factor GreB